MSYTRQLNFSLLNLPRLFSSVHSFLSEKCAERSEVRANHFYLPLPIYVG